MDELDALVSQYTQDIANNAPLTLKASKAIVEQASKPRNEQDTKLCATLVAKCYASEDFAEGQAAFAQKRKPSFRGGLSQLSKQTGLSACARQQTTST